MTEMITVERRKLEDVRGKVSPYGVARILLEDMLNTPPPMTEEDWERMVDEGFLCQQKGGSDNLYFKFDSGDCETMNLDALNNGVAVVREKGLRQPHFKGHPHPEGDVEVWAEFHCGDAGNHPASVLNWNHVKEYIVL